MSNTTRKIYEDCESAITKNSIVISANPNNDQLQGIQYKDPNDGPGKEI